MLSSFLLACSRGFVEARPVVLGSVPALLRPFTSTRACLGMEEFFAVPLGEGKAPQRAGRSWLASELRLKSFEDLHRLWFVCLKERNFLLTERLYYRQMLQAAPEPERLHKVKKTMAGIKVVIGERARASQALEEDRERERKVAAVASALVGMQEGASSRGSASASSASASAAEAGEAQPAAEAPTSAAAAPATPAAIKAERRSSVMDAEEEKARAALHRRKELLHVPVTYKKFGRKYTVTEDHPAPATPTRAERSRAAKTHRYFAKARALQAAPPTLPKSASFAFATEGQV